MHGIVRAEQPYVERAMQERGDSEKQFESELLSMIPSLRGLAHVLVTGTTIQVGDLLQETLALAWRFRNKYTPGTNLHAWIATIMRNVAISEVRKDIRFYKFKRQLSLDYENRFQSPDQCPSIDLKRIYSELNKMPEGLRNALVYVGILGLPPAEVAKMFNVAEVTIRTRVHRARERLRKAIGDLDADYSFDKIFIGAHRSPDTQQSDLN